MSKRIVTPEGYKAPALYSHAIVKSGTPVFLAGQVGSLPDGTLSGSPAAQVEQAFENVRAVVEACGGTLDDIVKLTIYVTSNDLRTAIADQRRARWGDGERPATTYLIVAGLATPDHLVELDAVAMIDEA
jgi:enamine deaminase RidA (YjgF/YER057c/UK114 family)